ncbi:MAG: endo-1,4-beta-xylanase [Lachnospiraceae bacterium]|nr:endo-1,4-beta-xylanase [Lachnospiraceae bacterium]
MKNNKFKTLLSRIAAIALVAVTLTAAGTVSVSAEENNLLNTYGKTYGYSGTCINLYQLKDYETLQLIKKNYNSITLENEMKPDALLGSSSRLISVQEAKKKGYYIPDSYKEAYVPQINFSTIDEVLKICAQNGLKMRAHTLVWHSQTPTWFFRNGFQGNQSFVQPATMDARMEMYIKTVMNHVYLSKYGDVVYAWDIANEYLHATNSGWEAVYGKCGTSPQFLKKAFTYANETLKYFKKDKSVKLFYNDFNTYMEVNDVIKLVNYINSDKKVCAGVGMQSHLGTNFPSTDSYINAMKSFLNAGFEVQVTEIDITNKGDTDLANYSYDLFKKINALKKNGGKITGVTWWGLSDQVTWIKNEYPLLFSTPKSPKTAYYKVLQAYSETFGNSQNNSGNQSDNSDQASAVIEDGWYYIKNTNAQKYLTVQDNKVTSYANVCISKGTGVDGQKWYVTNTNDGYITLRSKLGNFMLDVANGSGDDGANIGVYTGYSGDAQKFIVKTTKYDGIYTVVTKVSDSTKALDVYGAKRAEGTNVCQWKINGNANQQWQFEKVNDSSNYLNESKSVESASENEAVEILQEFDEGAVESVD